MQTHEIIQWIRKVLRADNFTYFKVQIEGKNSATEGYSSDMYFATIRLAGENKKIEESNLVFKFAKSAMLQKVKICYSTETFFYNKLLEIFDDFQEENKVVDKFDAFAKCYTTYVDNKMHIIVLENLKKSGFVLHRRDDTMNIHHQKIVIKNFAKFHALSLALSHKNKDFFDKISDNFGDKNIVLIELNEFFDKKIVFVNEQLRKAGRNDLAEKMEALFGSSVLDKLLSMLNDDVDKRVIVHSDCHCNNFMFKYSDEDKNIPSKVVILDWQMARIHSPAIDLGYFIYTLSSRTELQQVDYLLKYYHTECSQFLSQLGCDPEVVFPFSTLLEHWKKYSLYGFLFSSCFMDFNYIDDEDAPVVGEGDDFSETLLKPTLKHADLYIERLIGIVEHYFS